MFFALLVLLGAAWYFTTPQERDRFRRRSLGESRSGNRGGASRYWPARKPSMMRWTPAHHDRSSRSTIVALNVGIFVCMSFGPGSMADPETIVRWGGSVGTRTANGEWWRLATAMFVHGGFFQVDREHHRARADRSHHRALLRPLCICEHVSGAGLLFGCWAAAASSRRSRSAASAGVFAVYGMFVTMLIAGSCAVAIQRSNDDVVEDRAVRGVFPLI